MNSDDAFVLFTCDVGKNLEVKKQLENIDGIEEVKATYGVYDLIAKVKTHTEEHRNEFRKKTRKIPDIRSILTLFVTNEEQYHSQ